MAKKKKTRESLQDILASCSDTLFPAEMGKKTIKIDSRDVEGDTPLHVLLWREHNYGVQLLIEAGADVNAVGDMSETPLHIAVRKGNIDAVRSLLKADANPNLTSEFGQTARDMADEVGGEMKQAFTQN